MSRHSVRWNSRSDSIRSSKAAPRRPPPWLDGLAQGCDDVRPGPAVRTVSGPPRIRARPGRRRCPGFPSVQVPHGQPAAGSGGQQAFLLQLPQSLAQGTAADLEHLGQLGLHQMPAGSSSPLVMAVRRADSACSRRLFFSSPSRGAVAPAIGSLTLSVNCLSVVNCLQSVVLSDGTAGAGPAAAGPCSCIGRARAQPSSARTLATIRWTERP